MVIPVPATSWAQITLMDSSAAFEGPYGVKPFRAQRVPDGKAQHHPLHLVPVEAWRHGPWRAVEQSASLQTDAPASYEALEYLTV